MIFQRIDDILRYLKIVFDAWETLVIKEISELKNLVYVCHTAG